MTVVKHLPPAVDPPNRDRKTGSCGGRFAMEAEQEVVGAILLAALADREAGWRVLDRAVAAGLRAEHFASPSMAFLFRVVADLAEVRQPVDPLAVAAECERRCLANIASGIVDVDWRSLYGRILGIAKATVAVNVVEHRAGLVIAACANRRQAGEY